MILKKRKRRGQAKRRKQKHNNAHLFNLLAQPLNFCFKNACLSNALSLLAYCFLRGGHDSVVLIKASTELVGEGKPSCSAIGACGRACFCSGSHGSGRLVVGSRWRECRRGCLSPVGRYLLSETGKPVVGFG